MPTIKLTDQKLEEVRAFMAANPTAVRMDIEVDGVERQVTLGSFKFRQDTYFCAQYVNADGTELYIIPVCPAGDLILIEAIVVFLRKKGNLTKYFKSMNNNASKYLRKIFYYFSDTPRFDRLFKVAYARVCPDPSSPRLTPAGLAAARSANVPTAPMANVNGSVGLGALNQGQVQPGIVSDQLSTFTTNLNGMANVAASNQAQITTLATVVASQQEQLRNASTEPSAFRNETMSMFRVTAESTKNLAESTRNIAESVKGLNENLVLTKKRVCVVEERVDGLDSDVKKNKNDIKTLFQIMTGSGKNPDTKEQVNCKRRENITATNLFSMASPPKNKNVVEIDYRMLPLLSKLDTYHQGVRALSSPTKDQLKILDRNYSELCDSLREILVPGWRKNLGWRKNPLCRAVKDFVGGSSTKINKALVLAKGCVEALEEGPQKDACRNIVAMLQSLPPHSGRVYRSIGDCTDRKQFYDLDYMEYLKQPGAIHRENGFASCSLLSFDQTANMERELVNNALTIRRCNMIIQSKTARDIFCVTKDTAYKNERALLFPPGTEFEVTRYEQKGEQYYFWMEEV